MEHIRERSVLELWQLLFDTVLSKLFSDSLAQLGFDVL